ncbi:MAG: hypothetical protein PHP02_06015 [Eubacteriales bacterium]|nr:hypothetical protein [Eubacteriales bacterium]
MDNKERRARRAQSPMHQSAAASATINPLVKELENLWETLFSQNEKLSWSESDQLDIEKKKAKKEGRTFSFPDGVFEHEGQLYRKPDTELSAHDADQLISLYTLKFIRTIKNCMVFFVVVYLLGGLLALILLLLS